MRISPQARRLGMLVALLLAVSAHGTAALPEDRDQPIEITADKAIRNEKRGVTIYTGEVHMRQGTMELDADSLVVFHEGDDANKIIARGEPARMRQRPEPDEGLVHAFAQVITYYRNRDRVNLQTKARVEREDGTLVTGNSIDYYIIKKLITAQSDASDEDNKVFVVIPPSLHRDEEIDGGTAAPLEATGPPPEAPGPSEAPGAEPSPRGPTDSE